MPVRPLACKAAPERKERYGTGHHFYGGGPPPSHRCPPQNRRCPPARAGGGACGARGVWSGGAPARRGGGGGGSPGGGEALQRRETRERTRRCFALLAERVTFCSPRVERAVRGMAKGSLAACLSVCRLCLRHSREAVPDVQGAATRRLRAFFLPLFFVRDHGRYIISLHS